MTTLSRQLEVGVLQLPRQGIPCTPTNTGSESGASSSYRSRVPSGEDGLLKLPDECHHADHLLPQHDGVGPEWDPLPDHALVLLLYPPLRGQPKEGEAQVPELQDSPGEVQQLRS